MILIYKNRNILGTLTNYETYRANIFDTLPRSGQLVTTLLTPPITGFRNLGWPLTKVKSESKLSIKVRMVIEYR